MKMENRPALLESNLENLFTAMATISLSNVARILNLREMSGLKPRYLFKFC